MLTNASIYKQEIQYSEAPTRKTKIYAIENDGCDDAEVKSLAETFKKAMKHYFLNRDNYFEPNLKEIDPKNSIAHTFDLSLEHYIADGEKRWLGIFRDEADRELIVQGTVKWGIKLIRHTENIVA